MSLIYTLGEVGITAPTPDGLGFEFDPSLSDGPYNCKPRPICDSLRTEIEDVCKKNGGCKTTFETQTLES